MTIDNQLLEYIKSTEEQRDVSKLKESDPRKIRYNSILKRFDSNNNNTIAVFKLNDF